MQLEKWGEMGKGCIKRFLWSPLVGVRHSGQSVDHHRFADEALQLARVHRSEDLPGQGGLAVVVFGSS